MFVDDGSTDLSYPVMLELHARDPRFKVTQLSRNFGHQLAITAGIELARGDAVIVMDADLQHPPEVLPELAGAGAKGSTSSTASWLSGPGLGSSVCTARTYYRLLRGRERRDPCGGGRLPAR